MKTRSPFRRHLLGTPFQRMCESVMETLGAEREDGHDSVDANNAFNMDSKNYDEVDEGANRRAGRARIDEGIYDADYNASQPITVGPLDDVLSVKQQEDLLAHAWHHFKKASPDEQARLLDGDKASADALVSSLLVKLFGFRPQAWELKAVVPFVLRRVKRAAETGKSVFDPDRHF